MNHPKTFNESTQELRQAVLQIGHVMAEAVRADWHKIRRIIQRKK